jgi:serine protease Do
MIRKDYFAGAAIGLATAALAATGSYGAHAQAVNTPGAPTAAAPQSFADVVQKVAPAVVSIDVVGKAGPSPAALQGQPFTFRFGPPSGGDGGGELQFGPEAQQPVHGAGSGFFISADGYILTNNHVVQAADRITVVTKDGQRLQAHLVGTDAATDLAVVKVTGGVFPFVSFEDQAQPRVGDWVVAVGNPLGLGGTATAGIVSALGRRNLSNSSYVDYMQIDAPINRGNSGGPTFDVYGRVVGVNTAILSTSGGSIGIGFDIPADVAEQVSRQLIEHGQVVRGYIGATIQDVTPAIADSMGLSGQTGALIADVTPGGPSAVAGLRQGDVVETFDGRPVASATDLTRDVGLVRPGETVQLAVLRDGRREAVSVRSGARPTEASLATNSQQQAEGAPPARAAAEVLGMQLETNPSGGVVIDGARPDSDAGDKGLAGGDVILRAGQERVQTPADVAAAAEAAKRAGRKDLLVLVARNGQQLYVPLAIDKAAATG